MGSPSQPTTKRWLPLWISSMPRLPAVKPREVVQFLERNGFVLDRVTGSHFIYYHPLTKRRAVRATIAICPEELFSPCCEKQDLRETIWRTIWGPEHRLTLHGLSSQMVIPKQGTSRNPTPHEHPRRHYRQAHQDQRRARRTDRHPGRHSHLRTGRPQFRRLRPGSRPQLADSSRSARRAVHYSDQRSHHHAAGHRLFFLSPDDRGLSNRRRLLHRRALQPGRDGVGEIGRAHV